MEVIIDYIGMIMVYVHVWSQCERRKSASVRPKVKPSCQPLTLLQHLIELLLFRASPSPPICYSSRVHGGQRANVLRRRSWRGTQAAGRQPGIEPVLEEGWMEQSLKPQSQKRNTPCVRGPVAQRPGPDVALCLVIVSSNVGMWV